MRGKFILCAVIQIVILFVEAIMLLQDKISQFTATYQSLALFAIVPSVFETIAQLAITPITHQDFLILFAVWVIAGVISGLIIRNPTSAIVGAMTAGVIMGLIIVASMWMVNGIDLYVAFFNDVFATSLDQVVYRSFYVTATQHFVWAFIPAFMMGIFSTIVATIFSKPEIPKREMPAEMYELLKECPNCGAKFQSFPLYCSRCGTKLINE